MGRRRGIGFSPRIPSLTKKIAAKTSYKRYIRHNLGFKAPRGWGWLTNPRRAAYNRAYYRKSKLWSSLPGWIVIGIILTALLGVFH